MPARIRKSDVGKLLMVRFDDHSQGCGHLVYTEAAGFLVRSTRKELILRPWRTPKDADIDNTDSDFAIARSTIHEIERV